MVDKPKPKREAAVEWVGESIRTIYFYASRDACEDIAGFGDVEELTGKERYSIRVDARYDFQEVVDYIKNYG